MSIRLHVPAPTAPLPAATHDSHSTPQSLCLTLRLGRNEGSLLPDTLSVALGHDVEVFIMACDAFSGRTTLQIHVSRSELDTLMDAIMHEVPEAEFGYIQPMASTAVH
jgi:hypothetical protein